MVSIEIPKIAPFVGSLSPRHHRRKATHDMAKSGTFVGDRIGFVIPRCGIPPAGSSRFTPSAGLNDLLRASPRDPRC